MDNYYFSRDKLILAKDYTLLAEGLGLFSFITDVEITAAALKDFSGNTLTSVRADKIVTITTTE